MSLENGLSRSYSTEGISAQYKVNLGMMNEYKSSFRQARNVKLSDICNQPSKLVR